MLAGRYIEIAQEQIVETPREVAGRLAGFLGAPGFSGDVADVFQSRRENSAFPDREAGDFFYPVNWTAEQEAVLEDICLDEMTSWGYALDFEHPGGPDPGRAAAPDQNPMDMETYYRWLEGHSVIGADLAACRELVARINKGRTMRFLNEAGRLLHRLGLRRRPA